MTTVKPLPSVKLATAAVKCEMAAEKSYLVWHQMMRDLVDKDIKRQKEVEEERKVFELAKNMLAKNNMEIVELKDEIKHLRNELAKSKRNTQNIPTNGVDEALDALKRILAVDVSGRNAWTAHKEMQAIAKEVLGDDA